MGELEGWGKRRPDCARVTLPQTTKKETSKDRETSRAKEGSSAKDENTSDGDLALHIQPGLENKGYLRTKSEISDFRLFEI